METSDYQDSVARIKINGFSPQYGFSTQYAFSSVMLEIELLNEEFKLVVAEENKFKYGAKEKKGIALFWIFGLSRHWCKEHMSAILPWKKSQQLEFFDADSNGRDKAASFSEIWF